MQRVMAAVFVAGESASLAGRQLVSSEWSLPEKAKIRLQGGVSVP